MRNILFGLAFSLFFSGCATIDNASSVLYQEYSQYERSANKNNIIEVGGNFFTPSLLGKNYQTNPDATNQLLFKNNMVSTDSHYEKISEQEGCLTINGYDEENAPLIFSLKYISTSGRWLIDKIHVVFVENVKGFVNSAKCPNEYPTDVNPVGNVDMMHLSPRSGNQ